MPEYQRIGPDKRIAIGQHTVPTGTYSEYIVRINPITGSRSLVFRNRDKRPATYYPSLTPIFMEIPLKMQPLSPEQRVRSNDLAEHASKTGFNAYYPFSEDPNVEVYSKDDLLTEGIEKITVNTRKGPKKFFTEDILLIVRDENRNKAIIWTQNKGGRSWISLNLKETTFSTCSYGKRLVWRNLDSE